jgi:hypothetical protein
MLAGLIHALWNIAAKRAGGDSRFAFFTSALMMLLWAPLGLWLGWAVVPGWGAAEWALVVISGLLHVVYYVTCCAATAGRPHGGLPAGARLGAAAVLGRGLAAAGRADPPAAGPAGVVLGVFLIAGGPGCGARAGARSSRRDCAWACCTAC